MYPDLPTYLPKNLTSYMNAPLLLFKASFFRTYHGVFRAPKIWYKITTPHRFQSVKKIAGCDFALKFGDMTNIIISSEKNHFQLITVPF